MAIPQPTTWRFDDSTFGPQKSVPFNDNQQYPDCGPSIRVYTLENILYGLEYVITPLLQALGKTEDTSYNYVMTATPTALESLDCVEVTLWTLSSAAANTVVQINSGENVILEKGYSITIKTTSAQNIRVSQAGGEGDTLYYTIRTLIS